jgi:hypothetical protein
MSELRVFVLLVCLAVAGAVDPPLVNLEVCTLSEERLIFHVANHFALLQVCAMPAKASCTIGNLPFRSSKILSGNQTFRACSLPWFLQLGKTLDGKVTWGDTAVFCYTAPQFNIWRIWNEVNASVEPWFLNL